MLLLLPHDPLRSRVVDAHFARERATATELGIPVALVDHDAICRGDGGHAGVPEAPEAVYRGWMIPAARYAAWERALATRHTVLRTGAADYRRAHELPGWYAAFAHLTPSAQWTLDASRAGFEAARERIGAGALVLRDHSKSAKHDWAGAAYVPDGASADAAWAVASRLRELRDEDFTGGFVLRQFEPFVGVELRTWWVDGVCVQVGPHPDPPRHEQPGEAGRAPATPTGSALENTLTATGAAVRQLGLRFVTVDLAGRTDGRWRVVELGDGQVSDLRRTDTDPLAEMTALLQALTKA